MKKVWLVLLVIGGAVLILFQNFRTYETMSKSDTNFTTILNASESELNQTKKASRVERHVSATESTQVDTKQPLQIKLKRAPAKAKTQKKKKKKTKKKKLNRRENL